VIQAGTPMSAIWDQQCSGCHGANGAGVGGVKSLITRALFDQQFDRPFFDAVKQGNPCKVPTAVRNGLTDKQIWGQIVHVRELQGRALRTQEGSPKPDAGGVFRSKRASFRVEDVIREGPLKTPWGIDWLPDGTMLVTNRPGSVIAMTNGRVAPIAGTPTVTELGQGGMMDVAVHPDYSRSGWVYLCYTEPANGNPGRGMTKLVRGKLAKSAEGKFAWVNQQTIWQADPSDYPGGGVHFGSRIVFDKGYVFLAVGERAQSGRVQDVASPFGKIIRLHDDGRVPTDNPFAGRGGAAGGVWSYGHRNPQGMAKGLDGRLWITEHMPRGGDEVNEIVRGANYGWPVVSTGINYNDQADWLPWAGPGQDFRMPIFRWLPSVGTSGLDIVRGKAFPDWQGDLLAGGLVGNNVDRFRTQDGKLVEREEILHGMGRVRDISVASDGTVYIALNGPDKVIRLVPAQ